MTPEDRVRAGGVVLVFDAPNVPVKRLFALATAAREHGNALRLVVPVTAHTEKITHIQRNRGASYDATHVRLAFADTGVEVLPLDVETAGSIAARLYDWFPTAEAWQDAKWRRLHGDVPWSPNHHPPATIDWYTAAMCPPGGIVVTDDIRGEFRGCEVIRSGDLERVLRELSTGSGSL